MSFKIRLALAALCAVLALTLSVMRSDAVRAESEQLRTELLERFGGETVSLVVAAESLQAGELVSKLNTAVRDWPVDLVPEGALVSLDACAGKQLQLPVAKGAPLTNLAIEEQKKGLQVPRGLVAVSLAVNERLGLAAGAGVGSSLLAFEVAEGESRLLSSSVQVLDMPAEKTSFSQAQSITVAVAPDDVAAMLTANAAGTLRLALPASDVDALRLEGGGKDAAEQDGDAADSAGSQKPAQQRAPSDVDAEPADEDAGQGAEGTNHGQEREHSDE